MDYIKLETLLNTSKNIINTHLKVIKAKGEDFNIFSILNMETNETKTHSGMLVALLNPKGNHYHGTKFLGLFLKEIGYDYTNENLNQVLVKAEYHLGTISKDYENGGFIDILILFPSGKTITIENKIHAGDQPKQMYRYSLFNKGKSSLYYLNLFGDKPSKNSLHLLTIDDYHIISYSNEILNWLEQCLSVVDQGSIIETSIKQYQIVLKKLTHTMDNKLEKQFNTLILENLDEAKYIHANYQKAVNSVREKLRFAVLKKINQMSLPVNARLGNDINSNYSQLWLSSGELHDKNVQFGIESFSGKGNTEGRMFIGILDKKREYNAISDGDRRLNSFWPIIRYLKTTEGNPLNLTSTRILEKLSSDANYFEQMVNSISNETKNFVETYHTHYFLNQKTK
ncbi:PD-(D/E)XK nuclease family protein [Psychroserpens sp. SPM9]|uniref:PDDEXK-like family protein n=1 Tax=Psychroserpens sp. SPM9 TaxID=2975598 RepID=UPI0021A95FD4|nr:PD-(D/E)XK nuclease family protein [Psychroserpens sp. SPM9]MDG5493174.1 PD-(D/E)XK nuclease family protein [Psychroserpens sp. SPM9]